jgi:hypothetical protein
MYNHLSCAALKIKLTTGSANAGTCEKLHDPSRIRLLQKADVCASALIVPNELPGIMMKMTILVIDGTCICLLMHV